MTDEQRAAVERQQKFVRHEMGEGDYPYGQYVSDLIVLRDLYLAEHQADDAEPVTEGWLRSVGGVERRDVRAMRYGPGQPILRFMFGNLSVSSLEGEDDYYWHMAIGGIDFPDAGYDFPIFDLPATRGDVRRLCAALGIELKPE